MGRPALLMTAALILAFVGVLMRIGCFIARVLGRTPNLRFEFLATWPAAIWLRGPKSPFVRPETGLGEGVTFAARRGREVAHLGPNVRVFQRPLDILWTEKSKLASMLVVWSPRGPRVHDVGRMRRRGRVPGGLPDRPPDAARNATQAGATFAGP